MEFEYFSQNGEILPFKEAKVSLLNIEYSYGFGVYETLRVMNKKAYFHEQHIDRLLHSAEVIKLKHPFPREQLLANVVALVSAVPVDVYNLKILLIGAREMSEVLLYLIPLAPLFPDKKLYRDGASVITVRYDRPFPTAKTLNMLASYLAFKKARENNCYDALRVDENGYLIEGTRSNFLVIRGQDISVVPEDRILDGVTQRIVMHLAKKNGYRGQERAIKKADLSSFDGAFLTSTSSKIMPIARLDDYCFPAVPLPLRKLMGIFDDFLRKCNGVFKTD